MNRAQAVALGLAGSLSALLVLVMLAPATVESGVLPASAPAAAPAPVPAPEFTPVSPQPRAVAVDTSPTPSPTITTPPPRPAVKPTATSTQPSTLTLSPVTALRDQGAIDDGHLVTWLDNPCILAGHDYIGWAFLAHVPKGTTVVVTRGPCAGTYEVVAHEWHAVKGGPVPSWMYDYDLILQSCTGSSGTGFSMAMRR